MNRNIKLIIGLVVILLVVFSVVYFIGNADSSKDAIENKQSNTKGNDQNVNPLETDENMRPPRNDVQGQEIGENTGFPPEAIAACDNLEEGSECNAETPEGEEAGICTLIEEDLVCQFERLTRPQ